MRRHWIARSGHENPETFLSSWGAFFESSLEEQRLILIKGSIFPFFEFTKDSKTGYNPVQLRQYDYCQG